MAVPRPSCRPRHKAAAMVPILSGDVWLEQVVQTAPFPADTYKKAPGTSLQALGADRYKPVRLRRLVYFSWALSSLPNSDGLRVMMKPDSSMMASLASAVSAPPEI